MVIVCKQTRPPIIDNDDDVRQVAAHGTGASLPTVEEMVLRMKLVTPASGTMELSPTQAPELFQLAKVCVYVCVCFGGGVSGVDARASGTRACGRRAFRSLALLLSPNIPSPVCDRMQVGLGSLGIVSELTLQCVPQHQLLEKTYVVTDLNQVCMSIGIGNACTHRYLKFSFPHPQTAQA